MCMHDSVAEEVFPNVQTRSVLLELELCPLVAYHDKSHPAEKDGMVNFFCLSLFVYTSLVLQ